MPPTQRRQYFWSLLLTVMTIATALRVWQLATRPGFDWDETVYGAISTNMAEDNLLQAKTEFHSDSEPYLYHPPFYFVLLGAWYRVFGIGMTQGRALAVVGALITLVIVALWLRKMLSARWALVATSVLAIDGWVIFTNRVGWIENTMMPLGIAGLWLYYRALKKDSAGLFVAAGFVLGLVTVYKHVGIYFLVGVVIHWLIVRGYTGKHLALLGSALVTFLAYVGGMSVIYGTTYWSESTVQIRRILGMRESRGAVTGLNDIIEPLVAQYKIFAVSLLLVILGGMTCAFIALRAIVRSVKAWRARRHNRRRLNRRSVGAHTNLLRQQPTEYTLLFSWALGAAVCFAGMQLKLPHYLIMIQIPMICYLVAELARRERQGKKVNGIVTVALVIIVIGNAFAYYGRFVANDDNAVRDVAQWTAQHLPADAKILTEESIGSAIEQPYCKFGHAAGCAEDVEYIITYNSHTQSPPDNPVVNNLLDGARELARFKGFKEDLQVWEVATNK